MADERFNGHHRPLLDAVRAGDFIEYVGFGGAVFRRAGAVGMKEGAFFQRGLSQHVFDQRGGFTQGDVVADARRGDRALIAVGIDKHIGHRAENIGP